jgi:hypothetical protein
MAIILNTTNANGNNEVWYIINIELMRLSELVEPEIGSSVPRTDQQKSDRTFAALGHERNWKY